MQTEMVDVAGSPPPRGASPRPDARTVSDARLTFPPTRLLLIFLLLLVSAISWRRGVYYEGGADAVVVAKAAMTMLAFALAVTAPTPSDAWSRLRATPAVWLAAYIGLAAASGAIHDSETVAATVLAIRLALLAAVLVLVVRAYEWARVISALTVSMLALGMFSAVTGVASLSTGRLEGGLPPLSPNAISLLVSVPIMVIVWAWLNHEATWHHGAVLPLLFGVVWATGSRTSFAALLLAVLVLALTARRISMPAFATAVLAVPTALFVAGWTPLLSGFVEREGNAQGLVTLNSRTVAWTSAVDYADTTIERLVGAGLALKQIPVAAMYRDQQILDSSWVSALIQVGIIGIAILALLVISTLVAAFRAPRPQRSLYVAIAFYSVIVSFLESGMFDSSVAFIVFFVVALCVHKLPTKERSP